MFLLASVTNNWQVARVSGMEDDGDGMTLSSQNKFSHFK
jgi:hypothetical protein